MVMWFAVNRLKASNRYSMVPFSPKKGTPVETALVAEPGYVSVELKLARAVVQSVVVEAFANRAYSPHQAVVAFGLVPVVQQFDAAPAETDRVQSPVEAYAAAAHRDIDVVAHGLQLDPQVGRGEGEVGGNIRDLVRSGDLRMHHRARVPDPGVAQRAAARVQVAAVPRRVDVVRRRVARDSSSSRSLAPGRRRAMSAA